MATLTGDEISMLRNSRALAEARAETEAARLAKRRAAAAEIERREAAIAERNKKSAKTIADAEAKYRKVEAELREAEAVVREARAAASNTGDEAIINRLRGQLRGDAAPAIDAFLARLAAAEEAARAEHGNRPRPVGFRDSPEALERHVSPEAAAVERKRIADAKREAMDFRTKLDAFRSARVAVDLLREAAMSDDELTAALDAIGKGVGL